MMPDEEDTARFLYSNCPMCDGAARLYMFDVTTNEDERNSEKLPCITCSGFGHIMVRVPYEVANENT